MVQRVVKIRPTPEPPRPLGVEGRRLWDRVWALPAPWISPVNDLEHVTVLCESMDERVALRVAVLRSGQWRDRVALRALDAQVDAQLAALGLNPSERAKLRVSEPPTGKLAELRATRSS